MNPNRFTDRLRVLDRRTDRQPIRAEVPTSDVEGRTATIRLYDPVDSWGEYWGVSAKEFATALDELPRTVDEIRLHINSPGGDVFDGIAIMNALRSHQARIVAIVDGIAASAASFIACSADETIMAPNSELMIHDAWGLCVGNAAEMIAMAEMLDHISENIASIYAAKAGTEVTPWRDAMAKESWYSAAEAVTAGLADSVAPTTAAGDETAKNRHDLSIFTYAGRQVAPAPTAPEAAPASPAEPTAPAPTGTGFDLRSAQLRHLVASTPGVRPLAIPAS